MFRRVWLGLVVLSVTIVAAACGGGQPSGGPPARGTAEGSAINVTEKEWMIQFSKATLKPGKVKLLIKNDGTIEHNFIIEEAKVEVDAIQPGTTKELSVDLKPGTYTVICNIAGHQEAGMKTTITVAQ